VPDARHTKKTILLETWARSTLNWKYKCESFAPRGQILDYIEALQTPPSGPRKVFVFCNVAYICVTLVAVSLFALFMLRRKPGLALYVSYGAFIVQLMVIALQWINALPNGVSVENEILVV
jgi:hypothetical protein